jgi:hypothetical protein
MGLDYSSSDVLKPCRTKLDVDFRASGPHYTGWFVLDGTKWARISVPKGNKPIGPGLLLQMAKDLHLGKNDFIRLLDCPLSGDEYLTIQRRNRDGQR